MTAPKPTPIRDWSCPACHSTIGHVTGSGDLVITGVGVLIERTRIAIVVHCPCGASKAFNGRRVLADVPAGPVTKAA